MSFSTYWKCGSLLLVLPLYACAPLPQRHACIDCDTVAQTPRYAVARPHVSNDYPVSYRVQSFDEGHSKAVDQHVLAHQYPGLSLQVDSYQVK